RRRQYQYDARRQQGDGGGVFGDSQFTSTLSVNFHFPKIPRRTFFHGLKNVRVMSGSYPPGFQPNHPLYAIKLIFPSNQLLLLPTKIIPTHQQAFKTEGGGRLGIFCG
ncbi:MULTISPECIES: hypothetical protein, partial [Aeromonas]|uniref:hypothetical protein n=1 Tax=Aeromonas TaxID=642 RepID=UPI001C6139A1